MKGAGRRVGEWAKRRYEARSEDWGAAFDQAQRDSAILLDACMAANLFKQAAPRTTQRVAYLLGVKLIVRTDR